MKKILVAVLVLGIGSSSAALAQGAVDFASIDVDASGDVTLTEAQVLWADLTAEAYAMADANGDAKVDQVEFEAFLAANPPA
jgi:hypothetical protein